MQEILLGQLDTEGASMNWVRTWKDHNDNDSHCICIVSAFQPESALWTLWTASPGGAKLQQKDDEHQQLWRDLSTELIG